MSSRPASAIRRIHGSSRATVVSGPWPGSTRTAPGSSRSQARQGGDHGRVVAAGEIGAAVGAGEEDVSGEEQRLALLVQADGSLGVPRQVQHVPHQVADAQLLPLAQVDRGHRALDLEAVVVRRTEPIRIVRVDRQRRPRCPHQRGVVEGVVDVPVRVGDEVQPQPVGSDPLHQRRGGAHAGVEHERIGRAAVPDEVRVRLPRPEGADLEVRMVPVRAGDGRLSHRYRGTTSGSIAVGWPYWRATNSAFSSISSTCASASW